MTKAIIKTLGKLEKGQETQNEYDNVIMGVVFYYDKRKKIKESKDKEKTDNSYMKRMEWNFNLDINILILAHQHKP